MGFWKNVIKNFGAGVVIKLVLYISDIVSDAYNTYSVYQNCHYHLFYTSLVLLFLPNLVFGIGWMVGGLRF